MQPRDEDTADLPRVPAESRPRADLSGPAGAQVPPRAGAKDGPRYYSGARDSYAVSRGRGNTTAALTVFSVLLVCALALGAFVYLVFLKPSPEPENQAAPAATSTSTTTAPATTRTAASESSSRKTTERTTKATTSRATTTTSAESDATSPETSPTTAATSAAEPAGPPPGAIGCGASGRWQVFAASDQTSCPFAQNVALAAGASEGGTVRATSPVTGQSYTMRCTSAGEGALDCTNDTGAVVALRSR